MFREVFVVRLRELSGEEFVSKARLSYYSSKAPVEVFGEELGGFW